jgi:hypothetical protein
LGFVATLELSKRRHRITRDLFSSAASINLDQARGITLDLKKWVSTEKRISANVLSTLGALEQKWSP